MRSVAPSFWVFRAICSETYSSSKPRLWTRSETHSALWPARCVLSVCKYVLVTLNTQHFRNIRYNMRCRSLYDWAPSYVPKLMHITTLAIVKSVTCAKLSSWKSSSLFSNTTSLASYLPHHLVHSSFVSTQISSAKPSLLVVYWSVNNAAHSLMLHSLRSWPLSNYLNQFLWMWPSSTDHYYHVDESTRW